MTAYVAPRHTQQLLRAVTAGLTGRTRGPDHDPTGRHRTPRRHSYDVNDPKAQRWSRIGDGSVRQGLAHVDALVRLAKELVQQGWRDHPLAQVRDARARYAAGSAELQAHVDGDLVLPVGRPAALRIELAAAKALIDTKAQCLRRIDVVVLEAMLGVLDYATGRLMPSIDTIAQRAAVGRTSVIGALSRLEHHGLLSRVRRTIATGNDGEFAPQREQTSNGYYFEHRERMAPRVWSRYWQLLLAKLRSSRSAAPAQPPPAAPREVQDGELKRTLAAVAAAITLRDNAST